MTNTQAVIWDLGGVIVRTVDRRWRSNWEAELELEEYGLDRAVFDNESSRAAAVGQGNTNAIWAEVGRTFELEAARLEQLRADFWRGNSLDRELLDYIRGLRPAFRTGMITNAWPDTRQLIEEEWELVPLFDQIVISAEVGLAKPDPAIYQLALDQLGVPPEAAVFVDDFSENVAAARQLGMQAVKFEERPQAIEQLDRLLGRAD